MGNDAVLSVQETFQSGVLPTNFNANILVLIPKVPCVTCLGDYRPIALANFQFKVVAKILAHRLAIISMRIVSINQMGFLRECNISDCVIIASEASNLLDKNNFGGNLALKVDIRKAFDTLDWNFLLLLLQHFGFNTTFCNWISVILHSARLSILVNGKVVFFFVLMGFVKGTLYRCCCSV